MRENGEGKLENVETSSMDNQRVEIAYVHPELQCLLPNRFPQCQRPVQPE